MNSLVIGAADKAQSLLDKAKPPFLLIDDGPIADKFLQRFPKATIFDINTHSFNPLNEMDYKGARDFVAALYSASPEGENTLTVRNGKRALLRLLLDGPESLDSLDASNSDADQEAVVMIEEMLLSPVLNRVFCKRQNFTVKSPRGDYSKTVIARLNRGEIGDFDTFLLAALLIGQHKGQIIVPDFGFYGRQAHVALIRQNRLLAGVHFFSQLPEQLRNEAVLIEDKIPCQASFPDAELLARNAGLIPDPTREDNPYNAFIKKATAPR